MSRVSEASTVHAINYSVGKTKSKLENLQLQGSNLKRVQKPSDDPIGNVEILSIRSKKIDNDQYIRNASVAKAQLTFTETAIEELTELFSKAKEIAISQASNYFDPTVRQGVAQEVKQLRNQAISIANRRLGNKYIFSGFKTLTRPFDESGEYKGDAKQTKIEVGKDRFVPITFSGEKIFFEKVSSEVADQAPLINTPFEQIDERFNHQLKEEPHFQEDTSKDEEIQARELASVEKNSTTNQLGESRESVFSILKTFENALITNNHEVIQGLLPSIDATVDRLIETRTKIGSIVNSIDNSINNIEKTTIIDEEYKSSIEDADVAELFTNLTRQQNVLNATYKASAQMMNKNLMDFIN